jgi:hypothetical protein
MHLWVEHGRLGIVVHALATDVSVQALPVWDLARWRSPRRSMVPSVAAWCC